MEVIIATENLHKLREFRDLVKNITGIEFVSLLEFPGYIAPEETGTTFSENAELKALHAAKTLGKYAIADDSGLVVPALQGAPGVYSRRYAGNHATDAENRKKLLKEASHLEGDSRAAYFECALALASPEKLIKSIRATVEGLLIDEERGNKGFGYDSLFVEYDSRFTFAELDEQTKNRISHRHKALQKILPALQALLK